MTSFGQAQRGAQGVQVAHITVRAGYRPNLITAEDGVPLRLVFHRDEETACSERVVFSSPHLDRRLAPHHQTIVDLPAQDAGEVRFTCGMGRYRGRVRFVSRSQPGDPTGPLATRLARVASAAGGALLLIEGAWARALRRLGGPT